MMSYHERFSQLFSDYRDNYARIFNVLYPAKNSTGFTERNQSVNFAKAYQAKNPGAVTWYEFPFGEKNNLHYDAIIINPPKKEILLIESKRFNDPNEKIRQVISDIGRINRIITDYHVEFTDRITDFADYTLYGVILADVWTETSQKIAIWQAFKNHRFIDAFCSDLPEHDKQLLHDSSCYAGDFPDVVNSSSIRENYHLLALTWALDTSNCVQG